MFKVGDRIIIKKGAPYEWSGPGSIGVINNINSDGLTCTWEILIDSEGHEPKDWKVKKGLDWGSNWGIMLKYIDLYDKEVSKYYHVIRKMQELEERFKERKSNGTKDSTIQNGVTISPIPRQTATSTAYTSRLSWETTGYTTELGSVTITNR